MTLLCQTNKGTKNNDMSGSNWLARRTSYKTPPSIVNNQREREIDATNDPIIFPVCETATPFITAIATASFAASLAEVLLIYPRPPYFKRGFEPSGTCASLKGQRFVSDDVAYSAQPCSSYIWVWCIQGQQNWRQKSTCNSFASCQSAWSSVRRDFPIKMINWPWKSKCKYGGDKKWRSADQQRYCQVISQSRGRGK